MKTSLFLVLIVGCGQAPKASQASATVPDAAPKAGEDGATGAAGKDGPQGPQGPAGAPGRDGKDGAAGSAGQDGARGLAGAAGQDGAAGQVGATGAAGAFVYRRVSDDSIVGTVIDASAGTVMFQDGAIGSLDAVGNLGPGYVATGGAAGFPSGSPGYGSAGAFAPGKCWYEADDCSGACLVSDATPTAGSLPVKNNIYLSKNGPVIATGTDTFIHGSVGSRYWNGAACVNGGSHPLDNPRAITTAWNGAGFTFPIGNLYLAK